MFADLVGPTAPSARMDPEGLREVISACQKCVAETVQRFGRFVAKFVGDDFGYPQAHKDDAEGRERRTIRGCQTGRLDRAAQGRAWTTSRTNSKMRRLHKVR